MNTSQTSAHPDWFKKCVEEGPNCDCVGDCKYRLTAPQTSAEPQPGILGNGDICSICGRGYWGHLQHGVDPDLAKGQGLESHQFQPVSGDAPAHPLSRGRGEEMKTGVYEHKGNLYQFLCLSRIHKTNEEAVVYIPLFTKPEWAGTVRIAIRTRADFESNFNYLGEGLPISAAPTPAQGTPEPPKVEEIARLISEALKDWRSGDARYDSCKTTASVVVAILRPYFNRLTRPWYPIETAPKDGTEVLLRVKMRAGIPGKFLVGHWMPGGHCIEDHPAIDAGWYFWNGCMFDKASEPTQWSPLDGFLVAAPVRDAELKRLAIEACDGFDAQPNHGSPEAKRIMDALRNAAQGHTAVPVESFGYPWGGPDSAGNEPVTAPPCNCGAGVSARLYMHKTVCCWLRFVTSPTMNPPAPSQDKYVEFRVPNIEGHKPKE